MNKISIKDNNNDDFVIKDLNFLSAYVKISCNTGQSSKGKVHGQHLHIHMRSDLSRRRYARYNRCNWVFKNKSLLF